MRLAWFAATLFVAIFGMGELVRWIRESLTGPSWWAIDLDLWLRAGGRLAAGEVLYADPAFLYPPVAAVLAVPLRAVDPFALSLAYAVAKVALVVAAVGIVARDRPTRERALATVALVGSLPFLHDVFLGNANVLLAGAIALAVFARPSPRSGVALGLAAAVFAKPLLVPVLLWLLVFRRPVLAGTVLAGLATTAAGLLLAGPGAYVAWVGALAGGSRYAAPFAGNHGVTSLVPELWAPVAGAVALGLVLVLWRRGPDTGLAWAVTSGILIAPYAGTYSALPVAVAMPAFLARQPRVALAIVALSPLATTIPLPFYAAGILLAALLFRDEREARLTLDPVTGQPPGGAWPGR
jgi:hypothetical protein